MRVRLLMLTILLGGVPTSAGAATLYVAPSGSNTTACTDPANPCRTIAYAVGRAICGDTVTVADGTYAETITAPISCTAAQRLTIRSTNKWGAVLDVTAGSNGVLYANAKNYVTFDGFDIRASGSAPGIARVASATGVQILNIRGSFPCTASGGMYFTDVTDLLVDGCDVGHNVSADECTYQRDASCYAITKGSNIQISNSVCHDIRNFGEAKNVIGALYDRLTIRDMHNHGVTFKDAENVTVQRSVMYHTNTVTDISDLVTNYCSHGVTIRNNTVVGNGTSFGQQQMYYQFANCAGESADGVPPEHTDNDRIKVVNNIIVDIRRNADTSPIDATSTLLRPNGFTSNFNLFNGNANTVIWAGAKYATLPAWQVVNADGTCCEDGSSINAPPTFVNRAAYDFRLAPGSRGIDEGDNGNCAHAIVGARCDIGAFETGSTSDAQPPGVVSGTRRTDLR